jgi:hypothetical protein
MTEKTEPKILIIDIETQRAIVEVFSIFRPFIHHDRVIRDSRILCFAAKWRGHDEMIFHCAWDDDDASSYGKMIHKAWKLLDEADFVVGFNSDRFDIQWLEEEAGRLGLGRPRPYTSVDLRKIAKRRFQAGLLSGKLDWSARTWLKDAKVPHGGTDLWHDIRYGTRAERRAACALMREYNEHDTVLTERLFEAYLPWTKINLALFSDADDERLHCTKCNGMNLKRDGVKYYNTTAFSYQMWRCKDCGATSRGKRAQRSTQLRPV